MSTDQVAVAIPRLIGARTSVAPWLDAAGVPADLEGTTVLVDARENAAASQGFCDEMVAELVTVRGAAHVVVQATGRERIAVLVMASARNRGLTAHVETASA